MNIVIPTRGRSRLTTVERLPEKHRHTAVLVTTRRDEEGLRNRYPRNLVLACPDEITDIGQTRQWCVERWAAHQDDRVFFLDDDLFFYTRRAEGRFTTSVPQEVGDMLQEVASMMLDWSMVGVLPRLNAHTQPRTKVNGRMLRAFGVRARTLVAEDIRFDRWPVCEDFHVTLELLKRGYPNITLGDWAQEQSGGSGAAGGCSEYRTLEKHNETVRALAEYHAPFVRVQERTTKIWEQTGMGTRLDCSIQWAKAYASAPQSDRAPLP